MLNAGHSTTMCMTFDTPGCNGSRSWSSRKLRLDDNQPWDGANPFVVLDDKSLGNLCDRPSGAVEVIAEPVRQEPVTDLQDLGVCVLLTNTDSDHVETS